MTNPNMEILKKDVQTLINDAQVLFRDASDAGGDKASELRAQGASLLQQAINNLQAFQQSAMSRGKQFAATTDHYVHEKPWTSIAVSAGLGVVIGILLGRR